MATVFGISESQAAVFFRKIDTAKISASEIARVTRSGFLDPIEGTETQSKSRVFVVPADTGNGQMLITDESIVLQLRHKSVAAREPDRAKTNLLNRLKYLPPVINVLKKGTDQFSWIYSGAITRCIIPSTSMTDADLAAAVASYFGMSITDRFEDLEVSLTQPVDGRHHAVIRVQSFKRFEVAQDAAMQLRMHPENADERGIEIIVDHNSRLGFNLGDESEESEESVKSMVNAAFSRTVDMARELAERVS